MNRRRTTGIFGGGPAGLMAADRLSAAGFEVTVYDSMPTVGRKFLLAGKSGLNLTHTEALETFLGRYGQSRVVLEEAVRRMSPDHVRQWADDLGADTFAGSSGRLFPRAMKASPLLRAWLRKLESQGVSFRLRHRWCGMTKDGQHTLSGPDGPVSVSPDAALMAFGGGSWPRLGSDGGWIEAFREKGIEVRAFAPANCGFERDWSPFFQTRFAGAPVKAVIARSQAGARQGEFVISSTGIEGSLVYAHAAALREEIEQNGKAELTLDLAPGRDRARLVRDLEKQNARLSLPNRLRRGAGLDPVKAALIRELRPDAATLTPEDLAMLIKSLPLVLDRPRPLAEAISSAGGVVWPEIDTHYMLKKLPGVFVAGEMIDWEAPTGGYLLTACLATGEAAAAGIEHYLSR